MSVMNTNQAFGEPKGSNLDAERLPLQVEEITPSWLTSALARGHEGVTVESLAFGDVM